MRGAKWVAAVLAEAGWDVELDTRQVLLTYPRSIEFAAGTGSSESWERRHHSYDPDQPEGDVPLYSAWSASGHVEGEVIDLGRGLRDDYERLHQSGGRAAGKIVLASYGGAYRGVKAELAQEHGARALLLYSPAEEDGSERGEVWPKGPWKPDWDGQRGSISSIAQVPGDPSTPGWPSPHPGEKVARLPAEELDAFLPRILCTPIGTRDAGPIRDALARGESVRAELTIDAPRTLRTIVNVIARLGSGPDYVLAGNHRDAWVRGAHDAGSGSVALLRAAQHLGAEVRGGWKPPHGIALAFWDAEEFGLIGSTEWAEANADELTRNAIAYVNADACVSGTQLRMSGTPGLLAGLRPVLEAVPTPQGNSLWEQWTGSFGEQSPRLGLPGSGSDFTVFLHHLGLPVLDVSFGGNSGGQYHTSFDDFEFMDRFLDPTWEGHELAGRFLAALLSEYAEKGHRAFDAREAARGMGQLAFERDGQPRDFLEEEQAEAWKQVFGELEQAIELARETSVEEDARARLEHGFYRELLDPQGLPKRPWYRNVLWAPGLETGYAAQALPTLRGTQAKEQAAEFERLVSKVQALQKRWGAGDGRR